MNTMTIKKRTNVTTVTLSPEDAKRFKEAVQYYGFPGMSVFFRICGQMLCEHRRKNNALAMPFQFTVNNIDKTK